MMDFRITLFSCMAIILGVPYAESSCPNYQYKTFTEASSNADGLQGTVGRFQSTLGGVNNMDSAGQQGGFRAINWDGAMLPFDMPPNAFNNNRGAEFSSSDNKFVVSNPNNREDGVPNEDRTAPPKDIRFSSLNPEESTRFQVSSANRLLTVLNSNKMVARFFVPAMSDVQDAATSSGFGSVFTDVENPRATRLEFYDKQGCFIGDVYAPPSSKGLSFAGLIVDGSSKYPIYEVRITVGTKAIVSKNSGEDVVVWTTLFTVSGRLLVKRISDSFQQYSVV
jgi:hypothetical protein